MAKHTEDEMYQLPLVDVKKLAAEPEQAATTAVVDPPTEEDDEPETFLARRELDLGEGAGVEVFEAEGETQEEAWDALIDKIAEAKKNATKKIRDQGLTIRQQETELNELRAPKPKELSADDEYVLAQEFQKKPSEAFRKTFKELTGYEVEDFASVKQAVDAVRNAQQSNNAIQTFIATHPDYEDDPGKGGTKNGELMRMKLTELGLPTTSENLSKAYSQLKQSGLLLLKGEEANSDTDGKTTDTERIAQPKVEPAPQRTRKTSTISTHNRATVTPANTEPSEDEQYTMPMEKLRQLANKQMSTPR